MRIPKSFVDHYYDHICFMVDTNYTYAQDVMPRVAWFRPMQYEVNVYEVFSKVTTLVLEAIEKDTESNNTYEIAKIKMLTQTKFQKMDRKRKKMIQDLEGQLGEAPLQINEGEGEDQESEDDESEGKE